MDVTTTTTTTTLSSIQARYRKDPQHRQSASSNDCEDTSAASHQRDYGHNWPDMVSCVNLLEGEEEEDKLFSPRYVKLTDG